MDREESIFQAWKSLADRDRKLCNKNSFLMIGMDLKYWDRLKKECEWLNQFEISKKPLPLTDFLLRILS